MGIAPGSPARRCTERIGGAAESGDAPVPRVDPTRPAFFTQLGGAWCGILFSAATAAGFPGGWGVANSCGLVDRKFLRARRLLPAANAIRKYVQCVVAAGDRSL